ncbi:MAG: Gfo/Idh/MocA family oxidoreductase [Verrucomicrobiae bacterium]|nr:Gfo/Idh/MocA family oxidoreductase [Verrucomicrobiae bacterium]
MNRRRFLKSTASAAAGLAVPTIIPSHLWGGSNLTLPSNKINMGFIGVGGMGSGHLRTFLGFEDVHVRAICDVRQEHRDRAKERVDQAYGNTECTTYNDFRELLARDDIDAVLIAVPDHWHVLIGQEAARRGKAMYYEKPMAYTVAEAQAIRATINRYGSIFQFGTQQRSDPRFRFAVELARNGYLGQLQRVVIGSASFTEVPPQPEQAVPEGLDYNFWLGPAPWSPYTDLRCTRNWTLIRDYSLGCLSGAWGIHHVDIAQWTMDADNSGPISVEAQGSIPKEGLYDTFQHFESEHVYANGAKVLHMDHDITRKRFFQFDVKGSSMGILWEGDEGWVYVARGYINASSEALLRVTIGPNEIKLPISNDHRRNFLDAIRKGVDPICPVGPGVKSEIVCQQADIAIRVGQKLEWDNDKEMFINHPIANSMLSSPMRSPWKV